MKCSKCGKEFGDGTNCQNCGIDRVTGLANYRGYSNPSNSLKNKTTPTSRSGNTHQEVVREPKIIKVDSIVCHACGEIIPADSKFCPHCSINLYVTCPKCGHEYSSQYPACSKCGTNAQQYRDEELERIRKDILKRDREKKKRLSQGDTDRHDGYNGRHGEAPECFSRYLPIQEALHIVIYRIVSHWSFNDVV